MLMGRRWIGPPAVGDGMERKLSSGLWKMEGLMGMGRSSRPWGYGSVEMEDGRRDVVYGSWKMAGRVVEMEGSWSCGMAIGWEMIRGYAAVVDGCWRGSAAVGGGCGPAVEMEDAPLLVEMELQ